MLADLEDGPLDGCEVDAIDFIPLVQIPFEDGTFAVYKLTWVGDHFVYRFWRMG